MPDPIQVERLYQELKIHFESTLSVRHRYALFRKFIERLEGSFKKYETYIIQLLDDLSVYPNLLSWSGIDPEEIELDLVLLETLNKELHLSEKSENYQRISDNLEQVCLLLFSCLDDASAAGKYLKKMYSFKGLNSMVAGQTTVLEGLYNLLSAKFKDQDNISRERLIKLERLIKQIDAIQKKENGKAFVPVAEIYNQADSSADRYGRLRKILVEHYGDAESDDELIWNMNLYGAEKPSILHKKSPLIAARRLYELNNTKTNSRFFKGGARFEITSAVHDGESANLAISALWYSRMLEASGMRERYEINSHAALTGDIDDEGEVLPVDDNTISLKTKAVFFSWASVLVVPAIQRGAFEKEFQKLQEKYPHRKLALIGIDQLEELFYDRRVATHILQGRIKYYFNRIRKEQTKAAFIPVIVILLLIIARLMYGPIDRNAVALEFTNNHIVLTNQSGNVIQRIESNESTRGTHSVSKPNAILHDLTGDGKNELIYSNRSISVEDGDPKLRIWSVTGDSLIWEEHLTLNYEFPRQNAPFVSELRPLEIRIAKSAKGERIVVHTGSAQYFQGVIFVYSAENGDLLSEYVHTGQIRDMMILDLNEDNEDEIILTGVNNAFWQAFVAVLDINNAHGYSPATLDYQPVGIERANEMVYARIPKTIIGKYVEFIDKYNQGRSMFYDDTSDVLTILVVEGWRHFNNLDGYVDILLYFDSSMKPVGVGTSDVYDVTVKKLYEEGEIEQIPDFDYFEAYQDSILYWNGEEFLKTNEFFKSNELKMESR